MSELDKNEKKPFKMKVWMILLIYLVIAISVTCVLVVFNKSKSKVTDLGVEIPVLQNEKEYKNIKKITLKDKYAPNNIKVETIKEDFGDVVSEYDYNADGIIDEIDYRVSIEYIQISGLKDKKVESKINKTIKGRIDELKAEYLQEDKYPGNINIYAYSNSAGFGNTLSVTISATAYKDITRGYVYYWESECLDYVNEAYNFRLDTGDEFTFEDIFTDDADIYHILSQAIYENLASSFKYVEPSEDGDYNWDMDMDTIDYGQIEVDLIREINRFKRNKDNLVFSISNRHISISYPTDDPNDYTASFTIDMYDYVDYIAIYTRFLTDESLFEGGDLEPQAYVFRYIIEEDEYSEGYKYKEISNNVLLQMSAHAGLGYEQQIEERKAKVKNYLIRNAEKDMMYIYGIYLDYDMNWEIANGNVQIMTKKFYDENKDYILRYLDYSYETYEQPNYDTEKVEEKYFEIRFDENNNVIEFKYDDIIDEIESGTEEVIVEPEEAGDYTNSIGNNSPVTNTISSTIPITLANTVKDNTVDNNATNENVVHGNTVVDYTNTTVDNTIVEDTDNTTIMTVRNTIDTSNVGE